MLKFDGRASRSQYGKVFAALIGASVLYGVFGEFIPESLLIPLFLLIAVVGNAYHISYGIRRLHDIGKSGWWFLTILIPIANAVLVVALLFRPGTKGANQFGE